MYKVEVSVTFNYGGWALWFFKAFELPFAPFYSLWLCHNTDDFEHDVRLENNQYCSTIISYDLVANSFHVDVRNKWKQPVSDETIDGEIESFAAAGWERKDTEDIVALKRLMASDHQRQAYIPVN